MSWAVRAVRAVTKVRAVTAVGATVTALTVLPAPTSAQTNARLLDAIRLAQNGQQDSARAIVSHLIATLPTTDSVYPEALYTAGMLGTDARAITTNLQRVVVEYGHSPWADDALLRLTQFYYAQGDHASAVQSAERLRRDYPASPQRARAGFWGGRSYFQMNDEPRGCALIREAVAGAGDDVEFRNQVEFYAGRCTKVPPPTAVAASDSARSPSPPSPRGRSPAARAGFAVQVLAVRNAQQVDEMLTRLKVMGFQARVVRDSTGFFKVRVGPYSTRAEADRARTRLRTRLGGQPFVVEEP
jgi:cell division septation protein DedD